MTVAYCEVGTYRGAAAMCGCDPRTITFSWDSENLTFPEPLQTPKPFQDPHPPVWQAAASSKSAVSAGELGLGLLSFALLQPVETMAEHFEAYGPGRPPPPAAAMPV